MFNYDVVLCCYHGEKYIAEQLRSIIEQDIQPKHIYLFDDSNNNDTRSVIREICSELNFTSFSIEKGPQKGPKHNFLHALKATSSDFVFFSDQDDIWKPEKISVVSRDAFLTSTPTLWYSDAALINSDSSFIHDSFFEYQGLSPNTFTDDSIFYRNCVQGATICMNRSLVKLVVDSLGYINIDNLAMHDWWIALLSKYFGQSIFIDQSLIEYRQHESNQVGAIRKEHGLVALFNNPLIKFKSFSLLHRQYIEFKQFYAKYKSANNLATDTFLPYETGKMNFRYCGSLKLLLIHFFNRLVF